MNYAVINNLLGFQGVKIQVLGKEFKRSRKTENIFDKKLHISVCWMDGLAFSVMQLHADSIGTTHHTLTLSLSHTPDQAGRQSEE